MRVLTKSWIIVMFFLFTPSAFSELTPEDIQAISDIVEKAVTASEKRTREYIDLKLEVLEGKITTLEGKITGKIEDLPGRIDGVDRNINLLVILQYLRQKRLQI